MTDKDQDGWMIETNQWGGVRRYRKSSTGGIEYEMDVNGVPQSEFLESNRRAREERERQYAEERRKMAERAAVLVKYCPVMDSGNDQTICIREECALFSTSDGACIFAVKGKIKEVRKAIGKRCPFSKYAGKCSDSCALYHGDGCTFFHSETKEG